MKFRLEERLSAEVEGKSYGKYGYVVKVEGISEEHTDKGKFNNCK